MTYELDDVEKRALMGKVAERARADLNDGRPLTELAGGAQVTRRIQAAIHNDRTPASLTTMRAAIFDVIDAGCHHDDGMSHEWKLNALEESFANEQRCAFVDEVTKRIGELQAEPHHYDQALLGKLWDARAEYQRGYSDGWEDAMADDEEMRRRVREGVR